MLAIRAGGGKPAAAGSLENGLPIRDYLPITGPDTA